MDSLVSIFLLTCLLSLSTAQVPGPVQNLVINDIQQWGFTAAWDPPATGNTAELYNVTITNTNTNDVYERSLLPNDDGAYEINHLYDDTTYTFSVVAVNSDGQGGSAVENTGINIPPCQLCLDSANVGSNFFRLIFPATGVNTLLSGTSVDASTELTVPQRAIGPTYTSIFFLGLQGGLLYELQMTDSNTQAIVYSSRYRTVPNPATNLLLSPDSGTSVQVTYEQPIGTQYHKYDGFRITYGTGQERFVGSSDTSVVIDGLQAGISYTFEVQTFSGELADRTYSTPATGDIIIILALSPPSSLVAETLNADDTIGLQLSWVLPTTGEWDAIKITYTPMNGVSKYKMVGKTVTSTTLERLYQATEYTLDVRSVSGLDDLAEESEPVSQTALTRTLPADTMIITMINETTVSIIWTIWDGSTVFDVVDQFTKTVDSQILDESRVMLTNLVPASLYRVSVTDLTGPNDVIVRVFRTAPSPPSKIEVTEDESTDAKITFTWTSSPGAEFYRPTLLRPDGSELSHPDGDVPATRPLVATFKGLQSDTAYELIVRSGLYLFSNFPEILSRAVTTEHTTGGISNTTVTEVAKTSSSVTLALIPPNPSVTVLFIVVYTDYDTRITSVFQAYNDESPLPPVVEQTISGLSPATTYRLRVSWGDDNEEYYLTTLPSSPTILNVFPSSDGRSVLLNWSPPVPSDNVFGYKILYSPSEEDDGETELFAAPMDTSRTVLNLVPGVPYTFSLSSLVQNQSGDVFLESEPLVRTFTSDTVPGLTYVLSRTNSSIEYIWTQLSLAQPSYFILTLTSNGVQVGDVVMVSGSSRPSAWFDGLQSGTEYELTVDQYSLFLLGTPQSLIGTNSVITTTNPNRPGPVTVITVELVSLVVGFEEPPLATNFDSYEVSFSQDGNNIEVPAGSAGVNDTMYRVEGLNPDTLYTIFVRSVSGTGPSRSVSEPSMVQEATTALELGQIIVQTVDTTSITFAYGVNKSLAGEVSFLPTRSPSDGTILHIAAERRVFLTGLIPGKSYTLTLNVVGGDDTVYTKSTRTVPLQPPFVTLVVRYVDATVTWGVPTGSIVNGYEVSVDGVRYKDVPGDTAILVIEGLKPATLYEVQVRSVSEDLNARRTSSPSSRSATTQTALCCIIRESVTSTTVDAYFGELDGEVSAYVATLEDSEGPVITDKLLNSPVASFDNLDPSEVHTLNINSLTPPFESLSRTFRTNPPSPGDITIQEITSTSIRVSWDRAANDLTTVTGYVFSYVDASGLETETVLKPCDMNEYTLTGLNPDSYYKIIVKTQLMESGVFPEQEGDDDSSVQFNTDPVPEDTIVVQRRSTTTLGIVWNAEGLSGQLIRYRSVDSDDAEQSVSASGNTATLRNLLPGTLYSFQLGISGFTAASGIGRTVPRQPGTLSLTETTSTELFIEWPLETGNADFYRITVSPLTMADCPEKTEQTTDLRSVTLNRLFPQTTYLVTVRAVAGISQDQTESTAQSNIFTTEDALEGEVFLINRTSYSMEILFEPITAPSSTFPHVVTITPAPNDGIGDLLVQGNDRIVDIDNLTSGQTYSITIRRNEVPGPVRQITTIPQPPQEVGIWIARTTQTSLTALWEHPLRPSSTSPIPLVDQYVMEVTLGGNPAGSQTVDGEAVTATVDGLEVSTEYDVHVTSLAGVGVDNVRSDTVTVTASTVTSTPLPGQILVIAYTITAIDFVWGDSSNEPGFVRDAVTYSPLTANSNFELTGTRRGRLIGLTPGALYNIRLDVVSSDPQDDTTTQRTVPLPPTDLIVLSRTPLSVTFSWTLGNTELDNFTISYMLRNDNVEVAVNPGLTTYELTNLEPDTAYSFSMVTVSGDEQSLEVTTNGATDPLASNTILAAETTDSSIKAWFTPISGAAGPYGVAVPGRADLTIQDNEPLTFTLTGLSPSSVYDIDVYRSNQEYTDSVRTNPPNPGEVTSLEGGRFAVEFSFSAGVPAEAINSYQIYRQGDGTSRVLGNPSCCNQVLLATLLATAPLSFEETGLNPKTTYMYEISSLLNAAGDFPLQRGNQVQLVEVVTDELPTGTVDVRETTTSTINLVWLTTDLNSLAFFISYKPTHETQQTQRTLSVSPDIVYAEYTLDSLTAGELYTIRIQNGDNDLNDEITQRTRPNAITSLKSSLTTSTNITLNWNSTPGVVSYYEVAYDPPNGKSPRRTDVRADEPRTLTLSGLFPDSQYTVTVVTWSGTGEDATSSTPFSLMFDTAPILPLQVIVRFVNETEAQLTWGLVLGEDTYIITVDDSGANPIPSSETVPEGETPLSVRKGLTPGSLYTATVQTTTAKGPDQQFRTSPYPPLDLDVTDSTPTSINVAWAPPRAGGVFDEYILSYSIGDRIRTEVGRFAPDVTTATINNLNTATTYNIYLVTEANDGGFPQSSDVITREGRTEIPAPGEIVIIDRTPTSFRFQWGPSIMEEVTYITTYSPSDGSKLDTLSIRQSDVTGAIPGRLYELTVFVLPGDQQETGLVRTLPSSPGLLAVTAVDYVSVTLIWVPGTGEYTGFIISYKPTVGIKYIDLAEVDQDVRTWKVEGLSPDVSYDFQVVAVSGEHNTTYSEPTRRTNTTTLSITADAFVVVDYNSTSITVAWRDTNTNIIVNIDPQDDEARNVNVGDRPVHTFTGLNPSTAYSITSLSQLQELETRVRTNPASPSNLEVSKTSTSFSIEWEAAESEVSQYKVDVKCADMSCSFNGVIYPNERLVYELEGLFYLKEYLVTVSSCLDADGQFAKQMGEEPLESSIVTDDVPDAEIVVQETTTDSITIFYATGNRRGFVEAIYLAGTPAQVGSNSFVTGAVVEKTFDGLLPGLLYTIRITELTNTIMQRTVNVRTRPSRPSAVFGSPTSTVIPITWLASPGSISFYEVTYSPPDGTTPAVSRIDASGPLSLDIVTLLPQKVYTVFVRAVTGVDNMPSISEAVSGMFETLPAQPGEIILRTITNDAITYILSEVPGALQYVVQLNIGTDLQSANPHVLPNVEGEFDDLTPGQLYTLVLTVPGTQGDLDTIQVRTAPLAPTMDIIILSPTTILIKILPASAGVLDYYRVGVTARQMGLGVGQNGFASFNIPREACPDVVITDLVPGGTYDVEVVAVSGETDSAVSSMDVSLDTMVAGQLTVSDRTTNSLEVVWGAVTGRTFTNYVVNLFIGNTRTQTRSQGINEERKVLFEGLLPGTEYSLNLVVEGDAITQSTILTATAPLTPGSLSFLSVEGQEVTLAWPARNSQVDSYELCWTPSSQTRSPTADATQELLTLEQSDVEYTISLYAVVSVGVGDKVKTIRSEAVTRFITLSEGLEGELNVTDFTSDSISVEWSEVVSINFENYRLQATPEGDGSPIVAVIPPEDPRMHTFENLMPGVRYSVNNILQGSDPVVTRTVSQRTRPNPVSGLTVVSLTPQSITVTWQQATGSFNDYVVTYTLSDDPMMVIYADRIPSDGTRVSVIDGLLPDTSYVVTVYTSSGTDADQTTSTEEFVQARTSKGSPLYDSFTLDILNRLKNPMR